MLSVTEAESLFKDLVDQGSASGHLAPSVDAHHIDSQVAALAAVEITATNTAVNESRVDIEAAAGGDKWRVVFFVDAHHMVTDLNVWRRPATAQPSDGVAVVLNGPSGSGKSTLMKAISQADPRPWVMFDEPWLGEVRQEYLIWPDAAPHLHAGYLSGIAALAGTGNLVLLSAAGRNSGTITAAFAAVRTVRVGLHCPLDELVRRERGRPGRAGGLAEASQTDHEGWSYELSFDTSLARPADMAAAVLEFLR